MTTREQIAAMALQGLLAHRFRENENNGWSLIDGTYAAKQAVEIADALIAELRAAQPVAPAVATPGAKEGE